MASVMKIAVRYQSRGGNTKAVAEAIANVARVKAEPISVALAEPVDLLFIGGGVYAWDIDRYLKEYLESLDPNIVKSIAAFSTAGSTNGTNKIAAIARAKGINVHEETLLIKMGVRNNALLGGKGYIMLTDKNLCSVDDFVKKIVN